VCIGLVLDRAVLGHIFLKVLQFSFIIYPFQCSVFTFIHIPSTVCSLNTDISALVWTFLKKYDYLRLVEAKICKCKGFCGFDFHFESVEIYVVCVILSVQKSIVMH
jgi:hypothetical protein